MLGPGKGEWDIRLKKLKSNFNWELSIWYCHFLQIGTFSIKNFGPLIQESKNTLGTYSLCE